MGAPSSRRAVLPNLGENGAIGDSSIERQYQSVVQHERKCRIASNGSHAGPPRIRPISRDRVEACVALNRPGIPA